MASPLFHYIKNCFLPENESCISAFDMGLVRGYGVFDYVQSYEGIPFHLNDHLLRLASSAEAVDLALPYSLEEMKQITFDLLKKNPPINAGLRFIITGGLSGSEQISPSDQTTFLILFHPHTPYPSHFYTEGMKAVTLPQLRFLPSIKTTNYMPAIFGKRKALLQGCHDAIYSHEGQLLEGTTSNLFFLQKGKLITDNSSLIVKGVTRKLVLDIAANLYPIEYRSLTLDQAIQCEEAFLTSSIKDLIPLVEIDGKKIGSGKPGAVTCLLREKYHLYLSNYLQSQQEVLCLHKST